MAIQYKLLARIALSTVAILLTIMPSAVSPAIAEPMSFTTIGSLPGGTFTRPRGISADGSTVVGYGVGSAGQFGFRWTRPGGLQALEPYQGDPGSRAYDVSADGTVIVGITRVSIANERAVRWTSIENPQLITDGEDIPMDEAVGVSSDGSAIVANTVHTGYLINQNGVFPLPPLTLNHETYAQTISNDGTVVAGYSTNTLNRPTAIRWSQTLGVQDLGIPAGFTSSIATQISADGSTVIGYMDRSGGSTNRRAFRWTAEGGMENLGVLPDYDLTHATGVSGDGRIVVGNADDGFGNRAWIWTPEGGMVDLLDFLAPVVPPNCLLVEGFISDDGRVITGQGNIDGLGMAWVAVIPEPASGFMLQAGLICGLMARRRKQTEAK